MPSRPADPPTVAEPSTVAAGRHRSGGDRCPGTLRLHVAEDGALARIRIPGGLLDVSQAGAVAAASRELGDGAIHLTSRGNVQLRGLPIGAGPDLADRLYAVGLLPSVAHERARNVVASPLSGLDGAGHLDGDRDVQRWVRELDGLLCADPRLTQLSGRFMFGFDDGRRDIVSLSPDVTLVAITPDLAEVVLDGSPIGVRVPAALAASAAMVTAHGFLDRLGSDSDSSWRISDLSADDRTTLLGDVRDRLLQRVAGSSVSSSPFSSALEAALSDGAPSAPRLGYAVGPDGSAALSVGVPLGRMTVAVWNVLIRKAVHGGRTLRLTPWRGVVLPGFAVADAAGALASLSDHGLLTNADSPLVGATACAGRPGCARALADVHDDARRALSTSAVASGAVTTGATDVASGRPLLPVHWSGCDRRCGHPNGPHLEVVATGAGYRIGTTGQHHADVPNDEMAQAVSVARRAV